jgi:PAS domain S-box-containing protein
MKFNGALAFALLAIGILAHLGQRNAQALAAIGVAMLIGVATGLEYLPGVELGIDQWLVLDTGNHASHPGRMALSTVACLLSLGAAMAWRIVRPTASQQLARALAALAMVVAYVGSMGLLTQTRWDGWLASLFGAFSVPVAAVILLLGISVLQIDERRHDLQLAPDGYRAGRLYARIALPIGLLIPVCTAWAGSLVAAPLGIVGASAGTLALACTGALFALLVLASAGWIARLESALTAERVGLERLVDLRTTQYRAAEAREAQARRQLDMIVNSAEVAIAAVDAEGHVLLFNVAAERLFGWSRDALLGRPLDMLLPVEVRAQHGSWVRSFGATPGITRRMSQGRPVTGIRADGSNFPIEATISVSPTEPTVLTVVIRDLTVLQQLEAERQARSRAEGEHRARSELLSHINHEFRTPLNAVIGFSQLLTLQPEVQLSAASQRYVTVIAQAGESLLALVKDLTELGRVEAGALRLEPGKVPLDSLVRDCLDLQRESALAARLDWPTGIAGDDTLCVWADAERVRQILTNLLRNAIKYGRPGSQVRVSARPTAAGRMVAIDVSDEGIGMTAKQLAGAFEPYDRAGREGSDIEGTGLGLVIARRLAQSMNGSLVAQSEADVGSVFTLTLPAAGTDGPA